MAGLGGDVGDLLQGIVCYGMADNSGGVCARLTLSGPGMLRVSSVARLCDGNLNQLRVVALNATRAMACYLNGNEGSCKLWADDTFENQTALVFSSGDVEPDTMASAASNTSAMVCYQDKGNKHGNCKLYELSTKYTATLTQYRNKINPDFAHPGHGIRTGMSHRLLGNGLTAAICYGDFTDDGHVWCVAANATEPCFADADDGMMGIGLILGITIAGVAVVGVMVTTFIVCTKVCYRKGKRLADSMSPRSFQKEIAAASEGVPPRLPYHLMPTPAAPAEDTNSPQTIPVMENHASERQQLSEEQLSLERSLLASELEALKAASLRSELFEPSVQRNATNAESMA